ncbi:rhomboid family intramembrane serine protease [Muricauda sp. 2012CJ35-5]|uniref:Rhomboid family intramembrane serine protease n=1 Tax=Flagellimonas spongiicola TaxID=2942208 RepID=A0ABT0PN96_9FLAO|nr:rhomboid family intramembrane serine protease [Allomuricauda spongiicola]MCL6272854.1 rhomboid family intramembrane serine protease [Allomuricauda spongiicola]
MGRLTETVKHLIIINFIVWIGLIAIGNENLYNMLSLHFPLNPEFKPWQIITHMFMHSNVFFPHIFFNMLALYMFGSPLEQMWGRNKFLFFYFSAGLGAVLLPFAIDYFQFNSAIELLTGQGYVKSDILALLEQGRYNEQWVEILGQEKWIDNVFRVYFQQGVGASGCVMGLLVGFGMSFPNARLMLIFLPVPIKAKYFIPLILAYEIISGVSGGASVFGVNVAHFAHVGGALTGFIMMWYWKKNQFNQNRWD